jgi:23S rRNA (uracil1939-C5)-methyltransferase
VTAHDVARGVGPDPARADPADHGPGGLEVEIEALAAGGDGVAHLADGRVVFVDGGVPGDRVSLTAVEEHKRFARARVGRVVSAGPHRAEPRCDHFGRCGGCSWQHVDYATQLEAKRSIVADALERIGGLTAPPEVGILPSPSPYGYRARARVVEADGGVGFRVRGSHRVEPVRRCPVLIESAEGALRELVQSREHEAAGSPGTAGGRRRRVREWTLTAGPDGAVGIRSSGRSRQAGDRGAVEIEVSGERLRVSGESFVQGNALLWDGLVDVVRTACLAGSKTGTPPGGVGSERFIELYAGIGFFTLPLARSGFAGEALESDRSALADLAFNLRRSGLDDGVRVLAGRVERRGDLGDRLAKASWLLVDPPRAGLAPPVRRAIAERGPGRVVYVSCDPATLARDLAELVSAGYRLESVQALDLFPQTPHVETVVRLERGGGATASRTHDRNRGAE